MSRWSIIEDSIVCKFLYDNDIFISDQDMENLILKLKEHNFERSKEAVSKRVHNYQYLLTGRQARYATKQEHIVAAGILSESQISNAQDWISRYTKEVYCPVEHTDETTFSLDDTIKNTSHYLPISTLEVQESFYGVLDELLNQYYEKHKNEKKTLGAVKKAFKDSLVTTYGVSIDTFNAIRREKYETVSRRVLFKLCFALELDYEDAKRLLASVGYDFRRNIKFEVVLEGILKCESHRRFIVWEVNDTLKKNGCDWLF